MLHLVHELGRPPWGFVALIEGGVKDFLFAHSFRNTWFCLLLLFALCGTGVIRTP